MRPSGKLVRSLAACGFAAAAFLLCGLPAHAQSRIGGTGSTGAGSGGFGGSGGSGGSTFGGSSGGGSSLGSSNGQFSFAGGSTSGSFAGSMSGSFSGSNSGGSFSGTSGSFSGTSGSFSGTSGNFGGGYGGASGGMSISGGVSSSNFLASSYANPLAAGYASGSGTTTSTAFGQPLVNQLMTNPGKLVGSTSGSAGGGFIGSSGSGGMIGSASMRGGMSGGYGGGTGSGSTTGTGQYGIFALPYAVATNERYPVPPGTPTPPQPGTVGPVVGPGVVATAPAKLTPLPARVQTDLMGLVGRSDNVSAATRGGITLGYDANGTVVLRGTVASPAEARALESILRFAPGVSGVRNEMTLKGP